MKLSARVRRQLAAAGIDAEHFDESALERLPIVYPADLDLDRLEDPVGEARVAGAAPPVRLGVCEREGATIVLTWSAAALADEAERGAHMLAEAGVKPRMRIANTLEGGLVTPGSLLLGDAVERLGGLDVPLGPVRDAKTAGAMRDLLESIAAEVLVIDPASAPAFAPVLAASPPAGLALVLFLGVGVAPALPMPVRRWLSLPEIASFFALDCSARRWHVATGVRVEASGERLLLSAPERETPLLRYDARLVGRRLDGACACGAAGIALELDAT